MAFDFSSIRKLVQSAGVRLKEIRAEIETLEQKRNAVQYAPASRDEIKKFLGAWIDSTAQAYMASVTAAIQQYSRNTVSMGNSGPVQRLVTYGAKGLAAGIDADPAEIGGALCAALGHKIFFDAIDKMEWPANALSDDQRKREIETLNDRIVKLRSEEQSLLEEARESGLSVE